MSYALTRTISGKIDQVEFNIRNELFKEGFGILTDCINA